MYEDLIPGWYEAQMKGYPNTAGYTDEDTSKLAAEKIEKSGKAKALRERVLAAFHDSGFDWWLTADEVASYLCETVLNIRPRVSELFHQGVLEKTGERRKNASGSSCAVYRLVWP